MTPASINSSTWAFTFSTPASANTTGALAERAAPRLASSSTTKLLTGANVSATRHARIRREKWRSRPHLRFRRMHAEPGASPAVGPYQSVPSRRRRRHAAEPLRKDGERAGRDATVLGRGDHVSDRLDLGGRQAMR